jgi:tellurite methyltransferase
MSSNSSVNFFDSQFKRQVLQADLHLNPFEELALPYLNGRVLDYGCGLGNLSIAAAQRGCDVVALDASATAIAHIREVARATGLPIQADEADLRDHQLTQEFDVVACIGLLMFFDCPSAHAQLASLQSHLRTGGVAIVNVLVQGTSYLDMFDPSGHCLFGRGELKDWFAGWEILLHVFSEFPAPGETLKVFETVIAKKL